MINLAPLIPALPLAAFLLIGLVTRRAAILSGWLATLAVGGAWLLSLAVLSAALAQQAGFHLDVFDVNWLELGGRHLEFGFQVDGLTAIMLVVVTTVSALVHLFSQGYMVEGGQRDSGYSRYFAFLALFTFSMLGLVLANNLLTIYIFWELVGLCSYLLIGHWYFKPEAADAAKKAFVTTRFGDFGFLVGILLFWAFAGTLNFVELAEQVHAQAIPDWVVTLGALLIFAGAVGKSAQFPLHVWLPDAMEGPTPVSALIHAATMVAAGVYLVARAFLIFEGSTVAMMVVAAIGGFTAIFAATMGLVQPRIKRIVAYSTISQLGYMMLALGVFAQAAGMFHLFTHAFFKALLFLGCGSVMHALHDVLAHGQDTEDLRNMGGLRRYMPVTFWTMLIGSLALAGIFPFSGFWSKDEILVSVASAASNERIVAAGLAWLPPVLLVMALITVFLTAFYSFRLIFLAFFGEFRGHARARELGLVHDSHGASHGAAHGSGHAPSVVHVQRERHAHESPPIMTVPLLALAVLSVVAGFWGTPFAPGFQAFVNPEEAAHAVFSAPLAVLSTALALAGIGLAYAMYVRGAPSPVALGNQFKGAYQLLLNKYYLDELYCRIIDVFVIALAAVVDLFDRTVVDGVVNGVGRIGVAFGAGLRTLQTGRVQGYALAVFVGLTVIAIAAVLPYLMRG